MIRGESREFQRKELHPQKKGRSVGKQTKSFQRGRSCSMFGEVRAGGS